MRHDAPRTRVAAVVFSTGVHTLAPGDMPPSHHRLTPSTRLQGPDDAYVTCRDCKRTVIGKVGDERCPSCNRRHGVILAAIEKRKVECPNCGTRHHEPYGRIYCSKQCYNAHRAQDALDMAESFRNELNLGAATGWLRRLFGYLADRDGDDCYLCGRRIDLERKDMKGPSVDHLIPRSHGGTHDLANVALVHRICNSRKGNRAANEQLRLIG